MANESPNRDKEMLKWLKSQPDKYDRLEQIRELEEKD